MQKIYVLDTNILMQSPRALLGFDDNIVCITGTTLQELDKLKNVAGQTGYEAREVIRELYQIYKASENRDVKNIRLPHGGSIMIQDEITAPVYLPEGYYLSSPDNRIINTVLYLQKNSNGQKVVLVTNDISMGINARVCGLEVQGYHNEEIRTNSGYKGRAVIEVTNNVITDLYASGTIEPGKYDCLKDIELVENEYLNLQGASSVLAYYRKGEIYLIEDDKLGAMGIIPRNAGQRFALHALLAPPEEIPLVILRGPAGSAKTFLSLAAGLEYTYDSEYSRRYDKIIISRTNTLSDDGLGFLPGDLEDKMDPLIKPFMDNLETLLRTDTGKKHDVISMQINDMLTLGVIEINAVAYMRGRSIPRSFIIIDEAQNTTPGQALEIVTRAAEGAKVVLLGDPGQIDNARLDYKNNGLTFASERMKGSLNCAQIEFDFSECVRSALSVEAAERMKL